MITKALLLSAGLASSASAYLAEVNNGHLEFVSTGAASEEVAAAKSGVTQRDVHLQALEDALEFYPTLEFSAPQLLELFEGWLDEFKKEYTTAEEMTTRLLVFLENHGAYNINFYYMSCHDMCNLLCKAAHSLL